MKENQIESCHKCLVVKTYELHKKKALYADLVKKKKAWRGVLDVCAAAKHKIILPWPTASKFIIFSGWDSQLSICFFTISI